MDVVFEDEFCLIKAVRPPAEDQERVLLSFTGVGHSMSGIDVQKPEFFGAGRAFDNVLFISDLTRSWGNALDFDLIARVLAPYLDGRRVFAIGNSMGGFLNVVTSNFVAMEASVSIVPQFSISPEIVPGEKRWMKYRVNIREIKIPSLADQFNATTRYYLFSGAVGVDKQHWRQFPAQDNIRNIVIRWTAHDVAAKLKRRGKLPALISACFEDRFSVEWMRKNIIGGVRRV